MVQMLNLRKLINKNKKIPEFGDFLYICKMVKDDNILNKPILFLDNDGVICLSNNWGGRYKKIKKLGNAVNVAELTVHHKFDDFDKKAVKVLNEIIKETDCEIVVSSDWRFHATLDELGEYYESQGIIKKPIGMTPKSLPSDLPFFNKRTDLEESRSYEILDWLKNHPEVTKWVAVDDLDMSERFNLITDDYEWGLKNFVHTKKSSEGIKQSGIKEKIINFLK